LKSLNSFSGHTLRAGNGPTYPTIDNFSITYDQSPIPEPSSLAVLLSALAGFYAVRRRSFCLPAKTLQPRNRPTVRARMRRVHTPLPMPMEPGTSETPIPASILKRWGFAAPASVIVAMDA
ncbi:MAG: PEP-CTERM sorting domain-containing protein, partial [Stellaceae bacterium]